MGCQLSKQDIVAQKSNKIKKKNTIQTLENQKPNEIINMINAQLLSKLGQNKNGPIVFFVVFWTLKLKRFDEISMDKDQQLQILQFMMRFLQNNIGTSNEFSQQLFMKQIGEKFDEFEKRMLTKHQMCLQYFSYAKENFIQCYKNTITRKQEKMHPENNEPSKGLKFDMSFDETQRVAAKVREFCEFDMDSFAFLTLYLMHSANFLQLKGRSLVDIQKLLSTNLEKLEKIYPATSPADDEKIKIESLDLDLSQVIYQRIPEVIRFEIGFKSRHHQLEDYVLLKAQDAFNQEEVFMDLVKSICLQKGYAFKSGVKIKDKAHKSAIERTIEKILSVQKFKSMFKQVKTKILNPQQQMGDRQWIGMMLKDYVEKEKQTTLKKLKGKLKKENELEFNVNDLVRGKCMFDSVKDIKHTLEKLLVKIKQENFSFYEIRDRLAYKTKDVVIVINLKKCRAELQLALKFDKVANEFNHKIYELMRSIKFTSLTNLQIQNQRWAEDFFNAQLDLFYRILNIKHHKEFSEKQGFVQLKQHVDAFVRNFLEDDFLDINLNIKDIRNVKRIIKNYSNQLNQVLAKAVKRKI